MKNALPLFLFLPLFGLAQNKPTVAVKPNCDSLLRSGDAHLRRQGLQQALQCYLGALNCNSQLAGRVGPKIEEVFERIEQQRKGEQAAKAFAEKEKKRADQERDKAIEERNRSDRSARANRMAALALQKYNNHDYTLAWHLAITAWQIAWDSLTGGSTEPGVSTIMYDIVSDTTAWVVRPLKGHKSAVLSAVFSPDGEYILTASQDKTARLWDKNGNFIKVFEGHTEAVSTAVFSPDGKYILTTSPDKTARLWSKDGNFIKVFEEYSEGISGAMFSPGGEYILTVSDNKTARLWDKNGNFIKSLENHGTLISSAIFSPDSQFLLTASNDSTVRMWNKNGNFIKSLKGHKAPVNTAVFSPNGKFILTAGNDSTARLWDNNGNFIKTLKNREGNVRAGIFSPACADDPSGGKYLLTANYNTVCLWDNDGQLVKRLEGHQHEIETVVFSPNGKFILAENYDKALLWDNKGNLVNIWDGGVDKAEFSPAASGDSLGVQYILSVDGSDALLWTKNQNLVKILRGHSEAVETAIFSPVCTDDPIGGQYILTASRDGMARLWDKTGNLIRILEGSSPALFSPDGQSIFTSGFTSSTNRIAPRLWDKNGNLISVLEEETSGIVAVVFSHDSQYILTANDDSTAQLWSKNGSLIKVLRGHTDFVWNVAFSPDGQYILTASGDNSARLWDKNGNFIKVLTGHTGNVWLAKFSPDNQLIITGSSDETARLWDYSGNLISILSGHGPWLTIFNDYPIISAEFSPDSKYILTACKDQTARLWDKNGKLIKEFNGPADGVVSAVFSPDGQYVLTASEDQTARLWDRNGNLVTVFEGHTGEVNSAVFSPDGQYILTAGKDNLARLWESFPTYIAHRWSLPLTDLIKAGAELENISQALLTASIEDILDLGESFYHKQDWLKALIFYEKAMISEETTQLNPLISLRLYELSFNTGYHFDFQRLLIYDSIPILQSLGDYFLEKGKWREAFDLYSKIEQIEHSSEHLLRLYELSQVLGNAFDFQRFLSRKDPTELSQYATFFTQKTDTSTSYRDRISGYQSALRLREKQLTLDTTAATRLAVANEYNSLAFYQLFLPDGTAAEASLRRAYELDPTNKFIPTNRAPALLLQGRWAEAEAEYREWKDREYGENDLPSYRDVFLADLDELEKQGVTHPDFARVRALLKQE